MEEEPRQPDLARLREYGATPPEPKRRIPPRLAKNAVLGLFAAALVASPWILIARNPPDSPGARSSPTPSARSSPRASPSASETPILVYRVTSEICLRLRAEPGTGKPVLGCLEQGSTVRTRGETVQADGRDWLHVYDPRRRISGWAAAEFLAPVEG